MDEREFKEQQPNRENTEQTVNQINGQQTEKIERSNNPETVTPTEKNGKSKSKRRVLLLLLLLIATGFLLTTTTYAWFTSNRTVRVGDINVNVATSGGIQISVDGTNWKSVVQTSEITGASTTYPAATNQIPESTGSLEPVSTALDSLTNGYLSMWHGIVKSNASGNYILTTSDISTVNHGTTGYYVCFDLFFKVDAESAEETTGTAKKIYLTTTSDIVANGTDTGIKNAARVAFINEGAVDNGTALETIQALKTSTINSNIFLWEPNYDKHTASGVSNAIDVYHYTSSQISEGAGNNLLSYDGVKGQLLEADNVLLGAANTSHATKGESFAAVVPTLTTTEGWAAAQTGDDVGKYKQIFTLGANQITKMKIYFWVEGQDVDCENNASGGAITLRLQFSLNDSAE